MKCQKIVEEIRQLRALSYNVGVELGITLADLFLACFSRKIDQSGSRVRFIVDDLLATPHDVPQSRECNLDA
jgi:hypothetical protein